MSKLPGYVRYPDKWLAATTCLSDAAYRAYDNILSWMWLNSDDQCSIPDDEEILRRASLQSEKKFRKSFAEIQNPKAPLFKNEGDRLVSNGLRKEALKQKAYSDSRRESANVRWDKNRCVRNAYAQNDEASEECVRNAPKTESETNSIYKPIPIPIGLENGVPFDLGSASESAVLSNSVKSESEDGEYLRQLRTDLYKRIKTVTHEQDWQPWWHDLISKLPEAGLNELSGHVHYAEMCADPEQRKAKDLGKLKNPGGYLVKRATAWCKKHDVRWMKFPDKRVSA
jgi:uncharacterized protein YdaU (DUF1376 family)